jgi:hypothetical protein
VSQLRSGARIVQAAVALTLLGFAAPAAAFCRTTTCDVDIDGAEACAQCDAPGLPLFWKSSCVSFGVQQDGSPLRGITYDEAHSVIADAYARWKTSDCGEGVHPSIEIADFGSIVCGEPEYNSTAPNANVWMFRDTDWPYRSSSDPDGFVDTSQLAVTSVTYNPETGEIYDADGEFNSELSPFSLPGEAPTVDFASVVTHEIGHFLGLNHSFEPGSTMAALYDEGMASLEADDEAGLCAVFPPNRQTPSDSCTPRHGFSSDCGSPADAGCCSTAPGRPTPSDARGPWLVALVAGLVAAVIARRRGRLTPREV